MESLQMLKFSLKQDRLHFTQGLLTSEEDMLVPADDEEDLLGKVASGWDGSIDAVIAVLGQGDEGE